MQLALVPPMYLILNQQLPTQAIADTQCKKEDIFCGGNDNYRLLTKF